MDVVLSLPILIGLIVVALAFDFLNGLHDAANSIATIVSTRVLRPHYAVGWAAFFNFIAFLFFGLHVANTLGTGIIAATVVDPGVVFGALMGAIIWNLITWGLGIPSSSSHALVGGLVGAGIAKAGPGVTDPIMDHRQRLLIDAQVGVYRYDQLLVLRDTDMPAVLLEAGSIINREEELRMGSVERQALISAAVTDAIESFCAARRPLTPTNEAKRAGGVSRQATAPTDVVPVRAIKQR